MIYTGFLALQGVPLLSRYLHALASCVMGG